MGITYLVSHVIDFFHHIPLHVSHSFLNSDDTNSYVMSESGSNEYFVFLGTAFSCLLVCHILFFFLKARYIVE